MIEETGTSGCESTEEVSNSHGDVRQSRYADVTSCATCKRRRFNSQDEENVFQLKYTKSRLDLDVNFHENVVLTAVFGASDHVPSFICPANHHSRPDLKAGYLFETEIFISSNKGFSRETSTSEETESLSTSTPTIKKTAAVREATSRRKPSAPPPAKSPSPAELEEFFSNAEKYEQKRFAEKYNYDIVKDVPIEGRYQWVGLNP